MIAAAEQSLLGVWESGSGKNLKLSTGSVVSWTLFRIGSAAETLMRSSKQARTRRSVHFTSHSMWGSCMVLKVVVRPAGVLRARHSLQGMMPEWNIFAAIHRSASIVGFRTSPN